MKRAELLIGNTTTLECPKCGFYMTLIVEHGKSALKCGACGFSVEYEEVSGEWR